MFKETTVFIREIRMHNTSQCVSRYTENEMAEMFQPDELKKLYAGEVLTRPKRHGVTCQYVCADALANVAFRAAK